MYTKRLGALGLTALLFSGCSGGHGSTTLPTLPGSVTSTPIIGRNGSITLPTLPGPGTSAPTSHATGTAKFVIRVPAKKHAVASHSLVGTGRRPLYISASSQSVAITVNGGTTPSVANLTQSSANCTAATQTAPLTCSVSIPAPQGSDTFAVTTYDQQNAAGNALSRATVAATISGVQANTVNVTLNGVVASIALILANPGPPQGTAATIALTVNALDAAGNIIVGTSGYDNGPIALADSDTSGATTLSATTLTDPIAQITVAYNGAAIPGGSATFSATAAGVPASAVDNAVLTTQTSHDTWATKSPMPTARYGLAAGVINGVLYTVGGVKNSGFLNTLEAYDPATNMWTTKAPMPTARYFPTVGVLNGILYAVGGYASNRISNTIEAYDPATDTWTTKASMPTARYGLSAGVVNGVLYAVGGVSNSAVSSTLEAYDPATDTWTTKAAMPTARYGLAAGVINGLLYAVGGITNSDLPNTLEAYDPVTDTWTAKASMPTARQELAAGVVNGVLYTVGGYNNSAINTLEAYTP